MPLYVEHWNARPSWLAMPLEDRIAYLDEFAPALDTLTDEGATLVGMALTENEADGQQDSHYVAVWRMPDGGAQIRKLERTLERAGWRDYFEEDAAD